ncbi:hypothetical protein GCM10017691_00970 [Pseudonocardia petroleophila]|uniref:Septum formation family protein n=1 Tax=Pseudonocardia petroleophila TaxID=37331 RepID=A0A7G7MLE2_9PSEU|nr:septum formation family protein [Pseudonocardia petroleophila]QNG53603.1 septum formation family protein [Pseudonocardia petroleophila]
MNPIARRAAVALAAGALFSVSACSGTSVLNLEVGQCIADAATGDQVSSLPTVDCSEPHAGEIYALPQLPDGDFPGDEAVNEQAQQLCSGQAFQDYVGKPYQDSEIYYSTLSPSLETWNEDDDREIVCILTTQDGSPLEAGSLRGANR